MAPRQPFASLDAPRLRSFVKSRLNFHSKQNGKRKPLGDIDIDSENIDPTLNASSKRKRASDEDDEENMSSKTTSKPTKTSRIALKPVESSPVPPRVPVPPLSAPQPCPSTPKSAPSLNLKPAGRSPQSKSCKPFARRSNINKTRPEPASRKSVHRPFSMATALSNGRSRAVPAPVPTPKPTPASWSFEIHVDSEAEEMTNLMQHSTGVLDISDDESKQQTSSTGRGKENVPPSDLVLPTSHQQESPAAAARESVMMEESRAPLGELNASDYYGADYHAFSYAVVNDDEEDAENVPVPELKKSSSAPVPSRKTSTYPAGTTKLSSISSISSLLESTAPKDESKSGEPEKTQIDIWESESAAKEVAQADS